MKQMSLILALLLLLLFPGCVSQMEPSSSVFFYYPSKKLLASQEETGLKREARTDVSTDDMGKLIQTYLLGPKDPHLYVPVAQNVTLQNWSENDGSLELVFSDSLAEMNRHEITISCAALSETLFQLSNYTQITIRCVSAQINGKPQLIFTPDMISNLDTVTTGITEEAEATE